MLKFSVVAMVMATLIPLLSACDPPAESSHKQPPIKEKNDKCAKKDHLQISQRQAVRAQMTTTSIRYGTLSREREFSSLVEAPADEIGIVSPQLSGVVSRVLVDVGDPVRKGQVLLYISSPELPDAEASYFHALSKLEEVHAEAALITTRIQIAQKDVQRLAELVGEGIAAKKDLESAQARAAGTTAELVASESAAKAAEAQLSAARIRLAALGVLEPRNNPADFTAELPVCSPSSGVVVQRNVVPGQSVGPLAAMNQVQGSKPFISIAKLNKVWVMLEVPQSEVSELKPGCPVRFRSELVPGKIFKGKITRLGENFDPLSHCAQVRAEIDNSEGCLKPGTLVIASATAVPPAAGLIVPKSAIQDIAGQKFLFKQSGGNCYQKIPIRIVSESTHNSLVEGAILPGSLVVDHGAFFLKTEAVRSSLGAEE